MRDKNERKHRRTTKHPEVIQMVASAKTDGFSLAASMGLLRCLHLSPFPCLQCHANRRWNEAATGKKLTDAEFESIYTNPANGIKPD